MDCRIKSGNDEGKNPLLDSLPAIKEAERRQTQGVLMPCQRARQRATDKAACAALTAIGRARLSAFHHGTCSSDRTPPLSSSHALPGTGLGRNGCYPPPAVLRCSGIYPAGRS